MGRPIKEGLDYFPLNTANDDKMDLLEAKFGTEGFAVIIKLWQNAYRENGYFYPWGEDEQLLFSHRLNVNINQVNAIIEYAVRIGIFNRGLFERGVLTSKGMQKRYIEASKRRHEISLFVDLLLVNVDTIPVNVGKYPRSVRFNEYIGTQIEIEIKSNKSEKEKKDRSVSTRFRKPDLDEVRTYCNIRKNRVDPQRFLDFYESKGWKVGKTPMKDWKAAVRTWETNGHANGSPVLKVHERSTFLDMEEG